MEQDKFIEDLIEIKTTTNALADLVARLDNSTARLTDLSTDIGKLLAVQESRLTQAEKVIEKLSFAIEERRTSQIERDQKLHEDIMRSETSLEKKIQDLIISETKLMNIQMNSLKDDMKIQHAELNKKMRVVEKVLWGVAGVGSVIVFVISNIRSLKTLLGFE